jgi:hypothetical protein
MRIKSSVGRAPKRVSINEQVYNFSLTAETVSERRELAKLSRAIVTGVECKIVFDSGLMRVILDYGQ